MRRIPHCTILLLVAWMGQTAWSEPGGLAISLRSGTLGLGGELTANVFPDVNFRFGATAFDFHLDGEISDVDYDFDLDLLTFPILADWHPFKDAFHVSAGIIVNETDGRLDARFAESVTLGETTYTASEVGVLSGGLSFNRVAPYIGIGWGNAFGKDKRWGFVSDFGVAFIGAPDIALSATGAGSNSALQADLAREEEELQDDLSGFKIYPVLSVSLFYRF